MNTSKFIDVFPKLFDHLSFDDTLNLRCVCKNANRAVDKYLEEGQPAIQQICGSGLAARYTADPSMQVDITRCSAVQKERVSSLLALKCFMARFVGRPEKNPFISRSLHLHVDSNSEMGLISYLVKKLGRHIWALNLRVSVHRPHLTPMQMLQFLWLIFYHAPNLKKLTLHVTIMEFYVWADEEIQAFNSFLQRHPIPPLVHLNNMELFSNSKPIKEKFLAAYVHQLTLYSEFDDPQYEYGEALINVTNLTWTLHDRNFADLQKIYNLNCPAVSHLSFNLKPSSAATLSTCTSTSSFAAELFTTIEKFGTTLTHLSIFWTCLTERIPERHIQLPNLQEICLGFAAGLPRKMSLSFLQDLKNLKTLTFVFGGPFYLGTIHMGNRFKKRMTSIWDNKDEMESSPEGNPRRERIDLLYCLDDFDIDDDFACHEGDQVQWPYRSNIWRLLPSLDTIFVKICAYSPGPVFDRDRELEIVMYPRKELI